MISLRLLDDVGLSLRNASAKVNRRRGTVPAGARLAAGPPAARVAAPVAPAAPAAGTPTRGRPTRQAATRTSLSDYGGNRRSPRMARTWGMTSSRSVSIAWCSVSANSRSASPVRCRPERRQPCFGRCLGSGDCPQSWARRGSGAGCHRRRCGPDRGSPHPRRTRARDCARAARVKAPYRVASSPQMRPADSVTEATPPVSVTTAR